MTVALVTLVFTILFETAVALLLQRSGMIRSRPSRLRTDVPLVNLLTHPLATLAVRSFGVPFAIVEGCVVLVELLAYRCVTRLTWADAAIVAGVANGVTILLSLAAG